MKRNGGKSAQRLINLLTGAALFIFLLTTARIGVRAQQPFVTDDADVTPKGKFHFEFSDGYDLLQRSSFPTKTQNNADFELDYGLFKNLEIGVEVPLLTLVNDPVAGSRFVTGNGDANLGVKYNFRKEREGSRLPALSVTGNLEIPTGNVRRQLGSGLADFGVTGIAQKTLRRKNVLRVNAGVLFSGNTLTGVEGIATRGLVFTGGASLVRSFTEKLQLGVELFGALTRNFQLSKGQLQFQAGGNYSLRKNMTLDFGVLGGRFAASPRVGGQIGVSVDF